MTANYHTHTIRCHHATGDEREYIESAIKMGIKILGFSDHSPQIYGKNGLYYPPKKAFFLPEGHYEKTGKPYVSPVRMVPELAREYVDKIRALGEEYKSDIKIYVGFEAEYLPEYFDDLISLCKDLKIDYLIMGQHFLDAEPLDVWSGRDIANKQKLTYYADQVIEGLRTGYFSYLAHPDLCRVCDDEDYYKKEMTRLCLEAKALDIPLEFNMHGLAVGAAYPTERFYRIAAEVGNEMVIGIDAHSPNEITDTDMLRRSHEFLSRCGVTNIIDTVKLKSIV